VATQDELTLLPLPVAGLLSTEPYEEVAARSREVSEALVRAGCRLNYAFMTLSLLALVVLPELRVSDKGLVRVDESGFGFVDPIEQG
jgi:adenine deaminase